jgi:hypothetical protein
MQLRPVAFRYKPECDDGSDLQQYGHCRGGGQGSARFREVRRDWLALYRRYHLLNALLLNEVHKQHRQTAAQQEQIQAQAARIAAQLQEDARQR